MESPQANSMLDDRRIKLLNFLLKNRQIPEHGEFDLKELVGNIKPEEYQKLFSEYPEFDQLWQNIDMASALSRFLVDNGLADEKDNHLQLTTNRGRDLNKQGSYGKLLEDERHIADEARRVSELELEADRMEHRQYKINVLIAIGTCIAGLYYILEILDNIFGFYPYRHH